ncbi:MAG: ribosome biogenesis GTPase Der [Candidatus Eisenbacteria bacterium]
MRLPLIALVGRPNVGKSTLFNRLLGRRHAVVDDTPGVTRDRNAAVGDWAGRGFYLVDTGGWYPGATEGMEARVAEQVLAALAECDLVLFVVDAREGLQPLDEEISRRLHQLIPASRLVLLVNKADGERWELHAHEFQALGWPALHAVSATEGRGVGEVLDAVIGALPEAGSVTEPQDGIRVALLGRPNVGKSSLANRLLGEDRVIVDAKPGTTRDAIDVPMRWHGQTIWLIDTAGLRHQWDRLPTFEFYAALRSIRAMERSQIALLVLDASQPVERQDQRIASLIEESGRSALIVLNKWDLVAKDSLTSAHREKDLREELRALSYAPVLFVSALSGQRINRIPESIAAVHETSLKVVKTAEVNQVLERAVDASAPRVRRGKLRPRILYATQIRSGPPTFALFARHSEGVSAEYLRYLSRRFREAFGFEGSPILFRVREATGRRAQRPGGA